MEGPKTKTEKKPPSPKGFGALVFKNGVPHYELAADQLKIAIRHRIKGKVHHFPTVLSVPTIERTIELLEARTIAERPVASDKQTTENIRMNIGAEADFFDEHHVETLYRNFNRKLSTQELEDLAIQYNFKINTISDGFLSILSGEDEAFEADADEDIFAETEHSMLLYYFLGDAKGDEHRIPITLNFRPKTAQDVQEMRRAIRVQNLRDGSQVTVIKYARIVKICQGMVRSGDRILIGGKKCTPENQKDWAPRLPVPFQFNGVMRLYRGVQAGN
jgi:hypothetical protein